MPSPWAARFLNCSMTEKSNVKSDVAICGAPDAPVAPPVAPPVDPVDSPPLSLLHADSTSPTMSSAPTTAGAFHTGFIGSPPRAWGIHVWPHPRPFRENAFRSRRADAVVASAGERPPRRSDERPHAGWLHPGCPRLVEPCEHLGPHPERGHADHVALPRSSEHAPQPRELVRVHVDLLVAPVPRTGRHPLDRLLPISAAQVTQEFGDREMVRAAGGAIGEVVQDLVGPVPGG